MPIEPIESYMARKQGSGSSLRPFQAKPPGGEDPGVIAGFLGSTLSSIPELFGAPATQTAEYYRDTNPIGGVISQLAGFAVPYLGAERVAMLPSVAPRLAGGIGRVLKPFGMTAEANPVMAGVARELIVNAPVEASRLAVGSVFYPDNHDLWSDVAFSAALTGGVGGLAGYFRAGGKVLSKAHQIEGADIFMAPTHQLKLVLDGKAPVKGAPVEELIPMLRNEVFTETPGVGAASKKELDYVLPLEGMTKEEVAATNSLFKAGRQMTEVAEGETAQLTGLAKRLLVEGRGKNQLNKGEQQALVDMLPESFTSIDDVAKEVQFPRELYVADKDGARQLAGITSRPGWQQVSDRLRLVQERDGGFIFAYKLADGSGQAIGKGAGKTKVGERYLIGKTLNPGKFDPKAAKLAEMVTAKWATMGAAFGPARFTDVFNEQADLAIKAMSVIDYHNINKMQPQDWKASMKAKVGKALGDTVDSKLGIKDSEAISNFVDNIYTTFKPTEFLQRQNPVYGRFFGLLRSAQRTADTMTSLIMKGKTVVPKGVSQFAAARGKGLQYSEGWGGHRSRVAIMDDMTDDEANLMWHLSGTDQLSDEGLTRLVNDGLMTTKGAAAVKELRAIDQDVIQKLVLPVFKETGTEVKWLENHLGLPRYPRGDLFYAVTDEAGNAKHLAFGKTGAEAMREAKAVVEEAVANGKNWKVEKAARHQAAEPEHVLEKLSKDVFTNVKRSADEGEIIYQAMTRLSAMRATSGKRSGIAAGSKMFSERTGVKTSFMGQKFTKAEALSAMEGHTKQLLHFAAVQSWKERFGSIAAHMLQKQDPKLYADLQRKANQMMGIEGQITNVLNDKLGALLGSPKAATKIASAVNSGIANFNLFWLNPTFAILNLLTPLQTVAPWISHMRIGSQADLARSTFMNLTPHMDVNGRPDGVAAFADPMRILFQSVKMMRDTPDELRAMYAQADVDGVLHPQVFEEWLGTNTKHQQTLKGAFQADGISGFLKKFMTYAADESEKFSRITAFNSAYIVGKEYFQLEGDQLYRFMRRGVEMTQYNYAAIDRSRIFTGPVGSMFGLFKNWQFHFLGNMLSYAGIIKNDAANPAAWAPMLWTVGAATAVGGLGATPLMAMANGIANWNDEVPNSFAWMQKNFSPAVGDALYFGLPSFLGVSLQASAEIPGTDVRNETATLFSFAMYQRAKQLAQATGQIINNERTIGSSGLDQRNLRDQLFNAIMPRFVVKGMSAVEGDYIKSMSTGAPMVKDVSPAGRLLTVAGFNPVEVAQWQEASGLLYKDEESRKRLVTTLGTAYMDAAQAGDQEEQERIIRQATTMGILPSVMKSATNRLKREDNEDILSRYSKQMQGPYRDILAPQE
jgi:hypothetical protein